MSTFVPDLDVVYNALFRGFINHSTLWTHSLFVHAGIGFSWWLLRRFGRWPFLQTLIGLVAVGGFSHLILDILSHGTPLLYPLSLHMFGAPSTRVLEGGFWAYASDPIFLAEPFLLAVAAAHVVTHRRLASRTQKLALVGLASGLAVMTILFLLLLPTLQNMAAAVGADS
ncbi:MAG: metal-dependent hydrolase [Anaerolineae bacterium]|nr:metal-dependent hydrolase [Anaerolineae bacterium]